MVLTTELPFAVAAIRDLGSDAKITLIVPNRMHNLRFMLADAVATQRAPEQNVRPGKYFLNFQFKLNLFSF